MNDIATKPPYQRSIKSFVIRAGRMTAGQAKALAVFGSEFLIPYKQEKLSTWAAFGRHAPTVLEIGFGMGDATAHIASIRPGDNFLCCEVHAPGVGALLKRAGEGVNGQALNNIRIIQHDAVEILDHMLMDSSLDGIHIFFPDPWHKARHNKRRLMQAPFSAKLASKLKLGGYLHCATDWQHYAEQMLDVLSAQSDLENTATATTGYAETPSYRPLTKFERRGLRLGHGVWDLVFKKI